MKNIRRAVRSALKGRSLPFAGVLIFVVLLSAGSGLYAGASFLAPLANITITTTIFTTTTSWTTSTIWSTMTETVQGVLTTIQYTSSTSTVTVTSSPTTNIQTIGSTSKGQAGLAGYVYFWPITASSSGTLSSIGANYAVASGNIQVAIYSDNSGRPGTLLAASSSVAVATGWNDISISAVSITAGTTYWLAIQQSNANARIYWGVPTGAEAYMAQSYGSFPSSYSGSGYFSSTYTANMRIIYA